MSLKDRLQSIPGRLIIIVILAVLLSGSILLSLCFGAVEFTLDQILNALFTDREGIAYQIVCQIRLPRIILGALVGGALAVSGAILQGVMRNPLASPGIIGVSAGGGLTGVLVILALPQLSFLLVPFAFLGSLLTAALVYLLAWKRGASPIRLILAGVAVAAMLGAFTSTVMIFHADKAGEVLNFTVGSLAVRTWNHVGEIQYYMAAGFLLAFLLSHKLNILALGDEVAIGLGLRVELIRFLLIGVAALLAAAAVSVVGLLGFVGLIAPHMVRMVIGTDNRYLLPASALFGAFLVVICDTIGRTVMEPVELPVGIIMAMLGPPFFLWLLRRHHYEA